MSIERQELWCHHCSRYVQFSLDVSLDGNHVLDCPNCGHEHCRVVSRGRITSDRWDTRNQNIWVVGYATSSSTAVYDTFYTSNVSTMASSWYNTTY